MAERKDRAAGPDRREIAADLFRDHLDLNRMGRAMQSVKDARTVGTPPREVPQGARSGTCRGSGE